jgi:putative SOS response-associated peptidase YedK
MALAGLWENWHSSSGEWIRSFAIVTNTPNELCAKSPQPHAGRAQARGLAGTALRGTGGRAAAQIAVRPYSPMKMICWPISPRVGSVKNNDPSWAEPINLP